MENKPQKEKQLAVARSSRFPSIALEYAIDVVKNARIFGRNITDAHIAGSGSVKSGSFVRKKASLGYYGLISGKGNDLFISDLSEKILYPSSDKEKFEAIKEAFLTPEPFNKLFKNTEKGLPIDLEMLGNLVVREYSIQPSAKNEFLSTFINSGIFAKLIEYIDEAKKSITFIDDSFLPADIQKSNIFDFMQEQKIEKSKIGEENQVVEFVLTNGKARILVPKEITKEDVKKLIAQIKVLGNIFEEST